MFDGAALVTGAEVVQDTTTQEQTIPDQDLQGIDADPFTESSNLLSALSSVTAPSERKEVVFIDTRVENYQTLMEGIDPAAEVILLDSTRDGVEQIAETLNGRTNIDAIHLIAEGNEAELHLGSTFLTQESISGRYATLFTQIGQSLSAEADLLIYGCNFGEGEVGLEAMERLAELTGADIAASTDRTGHTTEYADWELEVATGTIESSIVIGEATQAAWEGVLATYTVTTTTDGGAGSLRQAIIDANANAGTDTITFVGSGTYLLTITGAGENAAATGDLDITDDLIFIGNGAGNTVIDASGFGGTPDRVFHTLGTTTVTMSGITIQGGDANNGGGVFVDNSSTLNLTDVIIQNNNSDKGGGLHVHGTLNLNRVLLYNNTSSNEGGAVHFHGAVGGDLTNSTFSGNTAIGNGGGIWTDTPITVTNSTFTLNNANNAGGIFANSATVTISNTILSDNTANSTNDDVVGNYSSNGFNLIKNIGGSSGFGSDITGVSANLDGLADNGGPTQTHALHIGSLAIDAGTTAGAPAVDQRGVTRDATPDIGAFEVFSGPNTRTFQQDSGGYTGTVDTYVQSDLPNNDNSASTVLFADGTLVAQQLIRFDNIFGPGPNQIPLGATITSATLTFNVTNETSGAATIGLHRMLSAWSDTDTWNSMTNGIDIEAAGTADDTLVMPQGFGFKTFSGAGLVATLQDWSDGQMNHGWAVFNNDSDALGFSSADEPTVTLRPILSVEFTAVNNPPVNVVPVAQTTNQDTTLVFSSGTSNQISISDPDAGSSDVQVTLTATNGTVTLAGTTGLSFSIGDGTADATMTFTGTIANINTALDGLMFDPTTSYTGPASLEITTEDQGNTGDAPLDGDANITTKYTFNVDGTDAIGTNDATLNNGAAIVPDAERGNVLTVDGVDDYAEVPSAATNGLSQFTVSFWVKTTETGSDLTYWRRPTLFGMEVAGFGNNDLAINTNNGFIGFWTGLSGPGDGDYLSTTTQINDNQWHQITVSNDGANASLYVDGVFEASLATGNGLANPAFFIGALNNSGSPGRHHSGFFDDVRIFDRSLTTQEVEDLYTLSDTDSVGITVNSPPTLDLDANNNSGATGNDYQFIFTEGDAPTAIADTDTDLVDADSTTFDHVTLSVSGLQDGNAEVLVLDSDTFALATANTGQDTTGGNYRVVITTGAGTATVTITKQGGGLFTEGETEMLITAIQYQHTDTNAPTDGDRLIDVTVNDGVADSVAARTTINVNPINDPPVFSGLDNTPTFIEGGAAVVLDNNATISDPELDAANNYNGATLTLVRNGGSNVNDVFNGSGTLNPLVESGNLVVGATTIGTVTTNSAGTLVLTFNGNATTALVNSTLQQITYRNTNSTPPASVQIDFTISDGNMGSQGSGGARNDTGSITVMINSTNTAPTLDLDANDSSGATGNDYQFTFSEGDGPTAIADSDTDLVDLDSMTFASVKLVINGLLDGNAETLVLDSDTFALATAVAGQDTTGGNYHVVISTGAGTATISITKQGGGLFNETETEMLIKAIQYQHTDTIAPADGDRLIDVIVNDGIDDSVAARTTINVNPVNAPPVAMPDSFTVIEGSTNTLNLAGNDTDSDDGLDLASIIIIAGPTNGTIDSINAGGTVTYTHNGSETLADSFTYTINDLSGATSNTVTVSLTITPQNDAPIIVSDGGGANASVSILTGNTTVTAVNATDAEGTPLTYSIIGGADAALFSIDPTTGALTFKTAPNVQAPSDVGGDNVYDVIVRASDGTASDTQAIAVTVTDVPVLVLPPPPDPSPESSPDDGDGDVGESENEVSGNVVNAVTSSQGNLPGGAQSSTAKDRKDSNLMKNLGENDLAAMQERAENQSLSDTVSEILDLLRKPFNPATIQTEIQSLLSKSGFLQDLDRVRDEFQGVADTEKIYLASSIAASSGLSIGYVIWLLRSGVLLTALLSSVPAWQFVNPLLILDSPAKKTHGKGQEYRDDDSVEAMFENHTVPEGASETKTEEKAKTDTSRWSRRT